MEKMVRVMRGRALCIATGVLFLGSLRLSPAQLPKSVGQAPTGAASTPAAKTDPLGRETPLGCVMGLPGGEGKEKLKCLNSISRS
jgi:hypothetical protein